MNGLRSMMLITALMTDRGAPQDVSTTPTVSTPATPVAARATAAPREAEAPATPSAAPHVAPPRPPAPGPGPAGGIPGFPDRRALTLSNVAAALRARGLTNQAMALTNRALAGTKAILQPEFRTGAVELRGIVNAPKLTCAVLEVPPRPGAEPVERILPEGVRLDDLEVLKIEPRTGEVTIRQAGEERVLTLPRQANESPAAPNAPPNTLDLRAARLRSVFDLYQEFAGRTVLRSPLLASVRLTVQTGPVPPAQTAQVLDQALTNHGILMLSHGEKFVLAVPARDAAKLDALPSLPEPLPPSGNLIPPGVIKFTEADCWPVLDIYQDLTGRTLLRSSSLPAFNITVKSQTELTRPEAIHMLDVLFALGGIGTRPDGDKFVFVVPQRQVSQLSAISTLRPPERPQATGSRAGAEAAKKTATDGSLKFQEAPVSAVLQAYADLAGRKAVPLDRDFPNVKLTLRSQTPLTRSEALYALQAVAALNHLHFAFLGDQEVKAVFVPGAERNTTPQ